MLHMLELQALVTGAGQDMAPPQVAASVSTPEVQLAGLQTVSAGAAT